MSESVRLGESQVAFITGSEDIDSDADWEAYLADVEAVGISRCWKYIRQPMTGRTAEMTFLEKTNG